MANYYAEARTNYFAVQDMEAFDAFCAKWAVEKIIQDERPGIDGAHGEPPVGFMATLRDGAGFPSTLCEDWLKQENTDSIDYDGPSSRATSLSIA